MALRHTLILKNPGSRPRKAAPSVEQQRSVLSRPLLRVLNGLGLIAIVAFSSIVLCAAKPVDHPRALKIGNDAISHLNQYSDSSVSLKYPANWQTLPRKNSCAVQTLSGQANIEWVSRTSSSCTTLDSFAKQFRDHLLAMRGEQYFVDGLLKDEEISLSDGTPARQLLLSVRVGQKRHRKKQLFLLTAHRGKVFILSCGAPSTYYADFEPLFCKVADSIVLK